MNGSTPGLGLTRMSRIPLDRLPRGQVGRIRALSQLGYVAHANHMVAISRAVCALILLLFAATSTPPLHFLTDFLGLFVIVFLAFAAIGLITAFFDWYLDFLLIDWFAGLDIVAFLVLIAPGMAVDATLVGMATCLIAHILFTGVVRWRFRFALILALLLNAAWFIDVLLIELPRGNLNQADALRWCLFVAFASLVVLWATTQMLKSSLPRFFGEAPGPGLPLAASAMGYAIATANASDAILCWINREDSSCHSCRADALTEELAWENLSLGAAEGLKQLTPMLFDLARDRAIVSVDGRFMGCVASQAPGYALLKELGIETGICIPTHSDQEPSCLILSGMPMLGWGHLYLSHAIRAEIAQGVAWQTSSANALDFALTKLRRTVACDLHDSVAHSLAGAKFLLVALRSKVSSNAEVTDDIDFIREALDAEHQQLRRLIEQLRETNADARVRNLIEDLEALCPTLATRWQISVKLFDSDFRVLVPVWFSLEVQQIVREAIANGARHGDASNVDIRCRMRSGIITIEITDDGAGFADPHAPEIPRSINERLHELGGSLDITTAPGATTLRMRVPQGALE
jgi:signal transduction histidine kinase